MSQAFILSIQSEVVYGHVGQGATRFALQRLGFEVLALPTVLLSNHPGYGSCTGDTVSAIQLLALLDGLAARGVLSQVAGVISGYLGHADHASVVAEAVDRVKQANPKTKFLCDPVFGDDDGAYGKLGVAEAIAKTLLPLADIVSPNRFELTSLTARKIGCLEDARVAAHALGRPEVLATSIPMPGGRIGAGTLKDGQFWSYHTDRVANAPHGTGDLLSALYFGWRLKGETPQIALGRAGWAVHQLILRAEAANMTELPLIDAQNHLNGSDSLVVELLEPPR